MDMHKIMRKVSEQEDFLVIQTRYSERVIREQKNQER